MTTPRASGIHFASSRLADFLRCSSYVVLVVLDDRDGDIPRALQSCPEDAEISCRHRNGASSISRDCRFAIEDEARSLVLRRIV